MLAVPPPTARRGDSYSFGTYRAAIPTPDIVAPGPLGRFRLKEWHYISVASPRWFFAFAVVNLGYVGKTFAYLIDRERPQQKWEYTRLHPLAFGLSFAESSVRGTTVWKDGRNSLQIRYQDGWQVVIDLELGNKRVHGEYTVEDAEALALLYRLPSGLPAYTHKAAGLRVQGALQAGCESIDLTSGVGSMDWTRSVAPRVTRWLWSSLQGVSAQGNLLGLNLSALVYDDEQGNSQENALWIDGRVQPLGGVRFELPDNPRSQDWRIRSRDEASHEVDLTFTPLGTREEQVNLGVVRSNFIQPYGTYRGSLRPAGGGIVPQSVNGMFGVVETHHSVW